MTTTPNIAKNRQAFGFERREDGSTRKDETGATNPVWTSSLLHLGNPTWTFYPRGSEPDTYGVQFHVVTDGNGHVLGCEVENA